MGKTYEELDLIDDFLMTAISSDPYLAEPVNRLLISTLLGRKVGKVNVVAQRVIPGVMPGYRGIRMDVEVVEESDCMENITNLNVYDIEPHTRDDINFPRHNRYYQAKIDSRYMKTGSDYRTYEKLPNLYVITILNFDLFGADYMMYTFENKCVEVPELEYRDGLKFIYFNTKGHKGGSEEIRNLLRYIEDSSESNVTDETTSRMHEYVGRIKMLPEVRDAYMTWDMYIKMLEDDKFKEGREKGELIKLISVIKKKIMKKKHIQEISEEIEEDENVVEPIYQFIMEHNGMDVEEIAEMLIKKKMVH